MYTLFLMTEEERQAYAQSIIERAAEISLDPRNSRPPFFRHRLTESPPHEEYDLGPAFVTMFLPDSSVTSAMFAFNADYIRDMNVDMLHEYLPLILELELPEKVLALQEELSQKVPEFGQWEPEQLMQTCAELGIPHAFLVFAEDSRTEEEVPLLFHPMFITPSQALGFIQLAAQDRLDFLTKQNGE